ncbi:MAG: protein translocase subunit SecF [Spirochaetaceae bacterium]|jgi:preprotein translocase subunit SecF|nr:protein translocase subunit SecF [Spirochaetaceae bacterium]
MKKIIRFSRAFLPLCIVSVLVILSGAFRIATKGVNFGLDFAPGLLEEVRIAPPAFSLTYNGVARAVVQTSSTGLSIIVSGAGAENATYTYLYGVYPTVGSLTGALGQLDGLTASAIAAPSASTSSLFVDSSVSTVLSSTPYLFHYNDPAMKVLDPDEVRDFLAASDGEGGPGFEVKRMGAEGDNSFQIRTADTGEEGANQALEDKIISSLRSAYGNDSVAVIRTDFIGAQFSQSLVVKSILTVLATLALIWVYSTIRFKWDFALGAVLAILHDALVMLSFIAWTQIEFSTIILASILTIIGYSINDTIVVLDRVRENFKTIKVQKFTEHLDMAQTEILSRTVITTITTLLAVVALFVFTTGSMKDFALCLIVGMISGVYSTIFITGGFLSLTRRNWKPTEEDRKIGAFALPAGKKA